MKLTQWTFFLDMLGYRDKNGEIADENAARSFLEFMQKLKGLLTDTEDRKREYAKQAFNLYEYYEIRTAFVSDSIIFTLYPKSADRPDQEHLNSLHSVNGLFIILLRLQALIYACFSDKQIFLRGGISRKFCYVEDEFAVGEGLIEAYMLESKKALFPRVVLAADIADDAEIMGALKFLEERMYGGVGLFRKDDDGKYFLDYFSHALAWVDVRRPMTRQAAINDPLKFRETIRRVADYAKGHGEAISGNLQKLALKRESVVSGSEEEKNLVSVIKKYDWLRKYHNSTLYDSFPMLAGVAIP